jgi:hypothetical protein
MVCITALRLGKIPSERTRARMNDGVARFTDCVDARNTLSNSEITDPSRYRPAADLRPGVRVWRPCLVSMVGAPSKEAFWRTPRARVNDAIRRPADLVDGNNTFGNSWISDPGSGPFGRGLTQLSPARYAA